MSYLYIHNPERTFSLDELVQNSFLQLKILEFFFSFFVILSLVNVKKVLQHISPQPDFRSFMFKYWMQEFSNYVLLCFFMYCAKKKIRPKNPKPHRNKSDCKHPLHEIINKLTVKKFSFFTTLFTMHSMNVETCAFSIS